MEFTKDGIKSYLTNAKDRAWQLIVETPIEVAAISLAAGIAAGTMSYHHESMKDKTIPLAFSEVSQVERLAEREGRPLEPINDFLPKVNDATMNVFEAWNLSYNIILFGSNTESFARELEFNTSPDFKNRYKYTLADLTKQVPGKANAVLDELKDFRAAHARASSFNNIMAAAWDDSKYDVTHEECTTSDSCSTDSSGHESCTTHRTCTTVCDYSIFKYTYHPSSGVAASRSLDNLVEMHPKLEINEQIIVPKETGAENEYAMDKSRERERKGKRLAQGELLATATTWYHGSTIYSNLPGTKASLAALHTDAPAWSGQLSNARQCISTCTNTASSCTSVDINQPHSFAVAEKSLNDGRALENHIGKMIDGLTTARDKTPLLQSKVDEYISVVLDRKPGDANKLKKEVIGLSREIYAKNFEQGFDVKPFKPWNIFWFTLLGLGLGAGVGFGVDRTIDKVTGGAVSQYGRRGFRRF